MATFSEDLVIDVTVLGTADDGDLAGLNLWRDGGDAV